MNWTKLSRSVSAKEESVNLHGACAISYNIKYKFAELVVTPIHEFIGSRAKIAVLCGFYSNNGYKPNRDV